MRFLNPVAVTCSACGQPTVVAEMATGSVRVHCGTWRWRCDVNSARLTTPDAASDRELAA
ncbi:MAG: hypothetical protein ACRDQX_01255 [Pseudonocardiaceae bacterium]